ncbi:MAG: PLDc N-terminal domain-containing protein, partial [Lachnospiraceae bacterium]|nr:PLDc N-terminal domain-containing protein [Lachnospiraceae bacterium]
MRRLLKIFTSRVVLVGLAIIVQGLWLLIFFVYLGTYSIYINIFFRVLSILILLYLIRKDENSAYKIVWIILIMAVPLLGGILYLMIGNKRPSRRLAKRLAKVKDGMQETMVQNEDILEEICEKDSQTAGGLAYIGKYGGYPVWKNTSVKYYRVGEEMFTDMLEDIQKARHYIFLEYYIIAEGVMWDMILELLQRKVKEGVDVRLIYDDVGCVSLLPVRYAQKLEEMGIRCMAFNRFIPFFSVVMNNRDHRKILVVDGHTAYNGGINLADEYINRKIRDGHWKDT